MIDNLLCLAGAGNGSRELAEGAQFPSAGFPNGLLACAPVIHDAAEMFISAVFDAPQNVHRPGNRHVADEPHGDDDPQMREHALEDDLYTGAVHAGEPLRATW